MLFTFLFFSGFCQEQNVTFRVTGKVKVDQGIVEGTNIAVSRNNSLYKNYTLNRTGSFVIPLLLNHDFEFKFSKKGYYTKVIVVDTHVPESADSRSSSFPPYQVSIMLFKTVPGVKEDLTPVGKIAYNSQLDNFDTSELDTKKQLPSSLSNVLNDVRLLSVRYEKQRLDQLETAYRNAINEAEAFYKQNALKQSMNRFRDAAMVKPTELYPRNRVDKIYRMLISKQVVDVLGPPTNDSFTKYINYADLKFNERDYAVAVITYGEAQKLKPEDLNVAAKLKNSKVEEQKLITLAHDELKHKDEVYEKRAVKYNELLVQGNRMFLKKEFSDAKDYYSQAVTQITENSMALLMIKKIDELFSNEELALELAIQNREAEKKRLQEARNRAYNDAVSEADRLFDERVYRDAIEMYSLALSIKNYEMYPKHQIGRIQEILADLQLRGEEYNRLLRKGDQFFDSKNYNKAKDEYTGAHHLIPDEEYATNKIAEINRILERINKVGYIDEKYNELIQEADLKFNDKDYSKAIDTYDEALKLKPNEKYPRNQINKINGLIEQQKNQELINQEKQNQYNLIIANADQAYEQSRYILARAHYTKALEVYPDKDYPKKKLKQIAQLLQSKVKNEENNKSILEQIDFSNIKNTPSDQLNIAYNEAIELGLKFFNLNEFAVARFYYSKALVLKPNDEHASLKIAEIDKLLLGDNSNEIKFKEMLKKADEVMSTGDFAVARFYLDKAKQLKPNSEELKKKVLILDQLINGQEQSQITRAYLDAMSKGKVALAQNNLSVARFYFEKALGVRPSDKTAIMQLEKVEKQLQSRSYDVLVYKQNVDKGDAALTQKRYELARNYFNIALKAKPDDIYVLKKLQEIQQITRK